MSFFQRMAARRHVRERLGARNFRDKGYVGQAVDEVLAAAGSLHSRGQEVNEDSLRSALQARLNASIPTYEPDSMPMAADQDGISVGTFPWLMILAWVIKLIAEWYIGRQQQ